VTAFPIWIAPTKIHRLITCLASGQGSRTATTQSPVGPSADIGSIAHRALERWVRDGLWKEDADGATLRRAYELEGIGSHTDVNVHAGGRLLGLRLKSVGKVLRDRLSSVPAEQVFPEQAAEDSDSGIRGVIDLLIVGDNEVHVYDYKTGRRALTEEGTVAEHVRTQLVAYGVIVSRLYPRHRLQLSVVSPSRGVIDVPWDAVLAARIKDRVRELHELTETSRDLHARPEEGCCRFCRRRLDCGPHWNAAKSNRWTDLVEGEVLDVRRTDSGQSVIAVKTDDSVSWVLNVSPESLPTLVEGVPLRLRGVRLKRVRPEGSAQLHFRANADSEVRISAPTHVQLPARTGGQKHRV
jgi:RecB family exonuclease